MKYHWKIRPFPKFLPPNKMKSNACVKTDVVWIVASLALLLDIDLVVTESIVIEVEVETWRAIEPSKFI